MNPIEFVFFDLGNVLVCFSHEVACQQMAAVAGVDVGLVRKTVFEGDLQARYERGLITTEGFVREFSEATGSSPDSTELIRAGSEIFELNTQIMPLVAGLGKSSMPIGILSNTCEAHWQHLLSRFSGLLDLFPIRSLSFELGCAKPAGEIYRAASKMAGVPPANIFFTDDRSDNVLGARQAGMQAHIFESAPELGITLDRFGLKW